MSLWLEATVELNLDNLDISRNPIDKLKAIFKKNGKVFQGHETIMYNGNGLVDTDWVYHPDNIISIDGGTD